MGLLPTPSDQAGQPPAAAAPADDQSKYVGEDEGNASEDEQAQYDEFVANAFSLIHTEEGPSPEIVEALSVGGGEQSEGGANPHIMALAQAAFTIVAKLDDSARESGVPIMDDVLLHGAIAVVEEVAEVAEATQTHEYSEQDVTGAFQNLIDLYRPKLIQDGRTTEEELKSLFNQINQADAAGELEQLLPGLDSAPKPDAAAAAPPPEEGSM